MRHLGPFRHFAWLALLGTLSAQAHFQELIPSKDLVTDPSDSEITLDLTFTHPWNAARSWPWDSRSSSAS